MIVENFCAHIRTERIALTGDTFSIMFVGNAMEDLAVGDFQQMSFIDEINDNDRGDTASVCSSISAGLASSKSTRVW